MKDLKTALVLIDGEHYPPVTKAALAEISRRYKVAGLVFLGGSEKVSSDRELLDFGYKVYHRDDMAAALKEALAARAPDMVIDLSDEPVVGYEERFRLAGLALAAGAVYQGADFCFAPPPAEKIALKPSLAVIGTGKRVGKTAVSAFVSRRLTALGHQPVVVAMGRGGPPRPEVVYGGKMLIDADYLRAALRQGKHAASDYFEDALMSRVTTIGCRRCGGGMAGKPYIDNVAAGARMANNLPVEVLIFEGSGAALPPVAVDAKIVVAGADQKRAYITGYLGGYRLLISDLAVLTNCEKEIISKEKSNELIGELKKINHNLSVVKTIFRPKPMENIGGERVFYTTTAPRWAGDKLKKYLEEKFSCRVVGISHQLADKSRLRDEILSRQGKFTVLLTELKAAAVAVSTELGAKMGAKVVYCDNIPVSVGGDGELGDLVAALYERARAAFAKS